MKKFTFFNDDLIMSHHQSHTVDFSTRSIVIINNIACIRHFIEFNDIYMSFYSLPSFQLKYRYNCHDGYIASMGSYFIEYNCERRTLFWFNNDGTPAFRHRVSNNRFKIEIEKNSVPIVYFNGNFIVGGIENMLLLTRNPLTQLNPKEMLMNP